MSLQLPRAAPVALADLARAGILMHDNKFREVTTLLSRHLPLPPGSDPEIEFSLRNVLMRAYDLAGANWPASLREADELLRLTQISGIWEDWAVLSMQRGKCLLWSERYGQAQDVLQNVVEFARQQVLLSTLENALVYLATGHEKAGRLNEAIAATEESFNLYAPLTGDRINLAGRLGGLYLLKGDFESARRYFRLSYIGAVQSNAGPQMAFALRGLARVAAQRGDYFLALQQELDSVRLFRKAGAHWQAGAGMGNVAEHYAALGDYRSATKAGLEALRSARRHQDAGEIQDNLVELGGIETQFGYPERAVQLLQESLRIGKSTGMRQFDAVALTRLANVYRIAGQSVRAIEYARQGAEIAKVLEYHAETARAFVELGRCYLADHQKQAASAAFVKALDIAERGGIDPAIVEAQRGLAGLMWAAGNLAEAHQRLEAAAEVTESLRRRVSDPELKSGFAGQNWGVYEDLVQVLAALERTAPGRGYWLRALEVSERGRSRAFLDMVAESRADLSSQLSPETRQRQIDLFSSLSRAYAEERRHPCVTHANSVVEAEKTVADWSRSLRYANPKYAELQYPEPLRAEAIERIAGERKITILEFALGDPISHLWVIGPKNARMVTLPKRSKIEQAVREFRSSVAHPPAGARDIDEFRAASAKLYPLLFARVRASEMSGRLLIIPDGLLYYLPFEALVTNGSAGNSVYLNDAATISYAPSVSVFAHEREAERAGRQGPRKELLAFGAPFFNGAPADAATLVRSAYDRAGFSLSPLPSARVELNMLRTLFPSGATKIFMGAKATERAFKAERLTDYRLIHFASHAILDETFPQRSGIVLAPEKNGSEDGILRMNEIMNLHLDADLVVLSACQTGLGKVVRGEGVIGLTRTLMYAGARQVAVSLWSVNDSSTAELMGLFYSGLRSGAPAADALRTARKRLAREFGTAYRHPYFWAPFVLVGAE